MKTKFLIIPIVTTLFLVSCQSSNKKRNNPNPSSGESSETTSGESPTTSSGTPLPSSQPIPSYNNISDYGTYSGTPGIGPKHISGLTITPNALTYAAINEVVTVTAKIDGITTIPEEERVVTFEINDASKASLQTISNVKAQVTCLEAGTVKLTAKSFESRYVRELEIIIFPNDGTVDFYAIDSSNAAAEKAKFGYESGNKPGNDSGDAQLGSYLWHFERSNKGNINSDSSGSGAIAFGTASGPEGTMTFSTTFTKQVKSVIIQTASAAAKDPESGAALNYGSSTLKAWFGTDDYLERTIGGVKYSSTEVSYTTKHSNDEPYSFHAIHCENKSGNFSFEFGPSTGAIYLKSIVIEYA